MFKPAFFLLCLLPHMAFSQRLIRFEAKTADTDNAQMTLGNIDVEIYLPDFSVCRMFNIDNGGLNFQQGVVDVFEGYDLQECNNFTIPGKTIGKLAIIHSGTDGWIPEWYALLFDDSTFIECIDDQGILDNGEAHDIFTCGPRKFA